MSGRKIAIIVGSILASIYILVGVLVFVGNVKVAPARLAADKFIYAIQLRDLATIYNYSDLLGPHLLGLLLSSNVDKKQYKKLMDDDFARWSKELKSGSRSDEAFRKERALLNRWVQITPVQPDSYGCELMLNGELTLVSYQDVPGEIHNIYYQLVYPSAKKAPRVSLFNNAKEKSNRRIKSVIVRVQTHRRPNVGTIQSMLLKLSWLEPLLVLYPFDGSNSTVDPSETWMTSLSFEVDKLRLETF